MILTQEQYQIALNKMPLSQIETLRILYYMPDSSATAKGLAIALGYKSFQGTNGQIGRIGKKIHEITGLKPKIYIDRGEEHLAYFEFVGPYTTKGWKMHKNLCLALEALNLVFPDKDEDKLIDRLPTEISLSEEDILLKEGKTTNITVDRFERNFRARIKCTNHYGATCVICGFNFQKVYGDYAEGYIQVHHIIPLSEINGEHEVNPINDLIPVCANCHAVIHMSKPALKIDEVKDLIKTRSR